MYNLCDVCTKFWWCTVVTSQLVILSLTIRPEELPPHAVQPMQYKSTISKKMHGSDVYLYAMLFNYHGKKYHQLYITRGRHC